MISHHKWRERISYWRAVTYAPHSSVLIQLLLPGSFKSTKWILILSTSLCLFLPMLWVMLLLVGFLQSLSLSFMSRSCFTWKASFAFSPCHTKKTEMN